MMALLAGCSDDPPPKLERLPFLDNVVLDGMEPFNYFFNDVDQQDGAIQVQLKAEQVPDCGTTEPVQPFYVVAIFTIPDLRRVALGSPIMLNEPDGPVSVELEITWDLLRPTGTITFDALDAEHARGSFDLQFPPRSSLQWNAFEAPAHRAACEYR